MARTGTGTTTTTRAHGTMMITTTVCVCVCVCVHFYVRSMYVVRVHVCAQDRFMYVQTRQRACERRCLHTRMNAHVCVCARTRTHPLEFLSARPCTIKCTSESAAWRAYLASHGSVAGPCKPWKCGRSLQALVVWQGLASLVLQALRSEAELPRMQLQSSQGDLQSPEA